MQNSVSFRWLGVAGVELTANGRTLVVDPFFSRPPFMRFLFGRIGPNRRLVQEKVISCDYVLVSHAHWDHIMRCAQSNPPHRRPRIRFPEHLPLAGAAGRTRKADCLIRTEDILYLDGFRVEVLPSEHRFIPFLPGPGPLAPNLRPPLRLRNYRMTLVSVSLSR